MVSTPVMADYNIFKVFRSKATEAEPPLLVVEDFDEVFSLLSTVDCNHVIDMSSVEQFFTDNGWGEGKSLTMEEFYKLAHKVFGNDGDDSYEAIRKRGVRRDSYVQTPDGQQLPGTQ